MNMENFMIMANVRPYFTCNKKERDSMIELSKQTQYRVEHSRILPDRYAIHIILREPIYLVDMCGTLEDIETCHMLESAKSHLYAAWEDAEEGEGWTEEQIQAMNYEQTNDALEGIGYALAETMEAAKTLIDSCTHSNVATEPVPGTDEAVTICHDCGKEL